MLGLVALLALILSGAQVYHVAGTLTNGELHPPRQNFDRLPTDVGIFDYHNVSFVTSDGLTIRGWLVPGSNGAIVILGHGNQNTRADVLPEAAILSSKGYGVLMFDWRAQGESDGDLVSFGQYEVRDLRAAVDFASQQPGVDPGRIGGLGFSLGGATMTLEAAEDDRIRAVIIEDTFTTLQDVVNYATGQFPLLGPLAMQIGQFQAGVSADAVRPVDSICRISPRPVLLIYGAQDDYLRPGSAEAMDAAACAPKDLWLVPGVGHGGFISVVPREYATRLISFFDQNLLK